MKKKFIEGIGRNCVSYRYDSINDMLNYISTKEVSNSFRGKESSKKGRYEFTGTKNFEEAIDLLEHGWEYMADKLNCELKKTKEVEVKRNKNFYSPVGYQACVPRYLQGMPDNMIMSKRIPKKEKVIVINKAVCYHGGVSRETIIKESVKVLSLIKGLETNGYNVELNVVMGAETFGGYQVFNIIKIKKSGERLNLKKLAFPLVHPSMLRRIGFSLTERHEETNVKTWVNGYGQVCESKKTISKIFKDEYFFPAIIEEEVITDVEKYRVV